MDESTVEMSADNLAELDMYVAEAAIERFGKNNRNCLY